MPSSLVTFINFRLRVLLSTVNNIDENLVEKISLRLCIWCKYGGSNRNVITETINLGIIIEII
jgi:hypothetical protein